MRFCPSCGRPLPEGLVIHCPSCGAAVPAAMNEAERLNRDAEQVAGDAAAAAKSLGDQFEAINRDPLAPILDPRPIVEPPGLDDPVVVQMDETPSTNDVDQSTVAPP